MNTALLYQISCTQVFYFTKFKNIYVHMYAVVYAFTKLEKETWNLHWKQIEKKDLKKIPLWDCQFGKNVSRVPIYHEKQMCAQAFLAI